MLVDGEDGQRGGTVALADLDTGRRRRDAWCEVEDWEHAGAGEAARDGLRGRSSDDTDHAKTPDSRADDRDSQTAVPMIAIANGT